MNTRERVTRATPDIEQRIAALHMQWQADKKRLGETSLEVERRRLQQEHIRRRWLSVFGQLYLAVNDSTLKLLKKQRLLELALAMPERNLAELEDMVLELTADQHAQHQRLTRDVQGAVGAKWLHFEGGSIDAEALARHLERVQAALRELKLLVFPDRLAQHPNYEKLTEQQRQLLADIWLRVGSIKRSDLRYSPEQLGYDVPCLAQLKADLQHAKATLELAGLDVELSDVVLGETPEARLQWLTTEVNHTKSCIESVEDQLLELESDTLTRTMYFELGAPEIHAKVKRKLEERLQGLQAEIQSVEQRLRELEEA